MTIEITIRFEDARADANAFFEDLEKHFDLAAEFRGRVSGGFYFRTERNPAHFFEWLFANNFEMSDFDSIQIEPA